MLNVPSVIKALYLRDGVRKNFRVHFPNGEFPDITNDNIVAESVKFTESLCSQNVFKFGLAEASVLEFETVGAGNMYGMTIEAGIEIDTSSLLPQDITAIQANQGDGVLVLASASDIGYGFYRIPYGTFLVTECPRNHETMTHRKVIAYSPFSQIINNVTNYPRSEFEKGKNNLWRRNSFDAINIYAWLDSRIGNALPDYIPENFTKTLLYSSSNMTVRKIQDRHSKTGTSSRFFRINIDMYQVEVDAKPDDLWEINIGQFDTAGATAFVDTYINSYGENLNQFMELQGYLKPYLAPKIQYGTDPAYRDDNGIWIDYFNIYADEKIAYMYLSEGPYSGDNRIAGQIVTVTFPKRVKIELFNNSSETTPLATYDQSATVAPTIYKLVPKVAYPNVFDQREPSSKKKISDRGSGFVEKFTAYKYVNTFTVLDKLEPATEIAGKFFKYMRTAALIKMVALGTTVTSITPPEYESLWWDEFTIDPIGSVNVVYDEDGEEVNYTVNIGSGQSVYIMEENSVLIRLAASTQYDSANNLVAILSSEANVRDVINKYFKPMASQAGFTPIDATMLGKPWLEAGDKLQFVAEDGTTVTTYMLRRELQGIQHLTDVVEAKGGKVIGEV